SEGCNSGKRAKTRAASAGLYHRRREQPASGPPALRSRTSRANPVGNAQLWRFTAPAQADRNWTSIGGPRLGHWRWPRSRARPGLEVLNEQAHVDQVVRDVRVVILALPVAYVLVQGTQNRDRPRVIAGGRPLRGHLEADEQVEHHEALFDGAIGKEPIRRRLPGCEWRADLDLLAHELGAVGLLIAERDVADLGRRVTGGRELDQDRTSATATAAAVRG